MVIDRLSARIPGTRTGRKCGLRVSGSWLRYWVWCCVAESFLHITLFACIWNQRFQKYPFTNNVKHAARTSTCNIEQRRHDRAKCFFLQNKWLNCSPKLLNKLNQMLLSINDAVTQWHKMHLYWLYSNTTWFINNSTVNTVDFSFSVTLEKLGKIQ